jgi:hypothetical protein
MYYLQMRGHTCVLKRDVSRVLLLVLFVAKILDIVHLLKPNNQQRFGDQICLYLQVEQRGGRTKSRVLEWAHQVRFFPFCIPRGDESRSNLQYIEVLFDMI